jgi:hypothetical protein
MTDHPAKGCSKAQREVFEQIATGVTNPFCATKILTVLEHKGLIAKEWELLHDKFGDYRVPRWYVPIPIHMQFCNWCSEQPEIVEEANCGD